LQGTQLTHDDDDNSSLFLDSLLAVFAFPTKADG